MASNLNDNLRFLTNKAADDRIGKYVSGVWQPFASVAEANTALTYRHRGMVIPIIINGALVDHHYRDGILNQHLIPKITTIKMTYSTTVNIAITIPPDSDISHIRVKPTSELTAFRIGTSAGLDNIVPQSVIPVGEWQVFNVGKYFEDGATFHIQGILGTTNITIIRL